MLDIYYYSRHHRPKENELLWSLTDVEYGHLCACFEKYRHKTGKVIEEYGDTELPAGTLAPFIASCHEALAVQDNPYVKRTLGKLLDILESAVMQSRGIGFYGD